MHDHMKTITLTDDAYRRLIEWKTGATDSFSRVVLRIVPKKGTFGQLLEDVQRLPALSDKQARVMEETATWGRDRRHNRDPWTT
jgi:predicted CopG family antitoxin